MAGYFFPSLAVSIRTIFKAVKDMDPSKVLNGGCMAVMSRSWTSAKIIFTASKIFSGALKDTNEKQVLPHGGRTIRIPSLEESMVARNGGHSTIRMVKIKTYEEVYTGKFSVSPGFFLFLT